MKNENLTKEELWEVIRAQSKELATLTGMYNHLSDLNLPYERLSPISHYISEKYDDFTKNLKELSVLLADDVLR